MRWARQAPPSLSEAHRLILQRNCRAPTVPHPSSSSSSAAPTPNRSSHTAATFTATALHPNPLCCPRSAGYHSSCQSWKMGVLYLHHHHPPASFPGSIPLPLLWLFLASCLRQMKLHHPEMLAKHILGCTLIQHLDPGLAVGRRRQQRSSGGSWGHGQVVKCRLDKNGKMAGR